MKSITILVPCYNESASLHLFYERMADVMGKIDEYVFHILFVNDGSRDSTLDIMRKLHAADARVSYLDLSRNFGKEAAMLAGLENAKGDYMVLMDVDLQDPPSLLEKMYNFINQEGYNCVATKRKNRTESLL